jgi:hypothetical protein
MSLLAWSEERPDWLRDALRRLAVNGEVGDGDREAILIRVRHAHGITVDGDITCMPLTADHLPPDGEAIAPTLLYGIGPVCNVDRLAQDQQLRFGVNGITLVFGDNATGKSGYARIAKKLCRARVVDELRGDVFAAQISPAATARVRFRLPGMEDPQDLEWTDGDPAPELLSRIMVLDEASARIYVDGRNEITYLPREIEVAAQFGSVCTSLSAQLEQEVDAIERRCRAPVGAGYSNATDAGTLISRLTLEMPLHNLPNEAALRIAAQWNQGNEDELATITAALANNPAAQAATRRRIIAALNPLADDLDATADALSDEAIRAIRLRIVEAVAADAAAARAAGAQFAEEALPGTGQETWKRLYGFARQFAAEAGIRAEDAPFETGDPCPVCQRALTEADAARLQRFDDFVRGVAAQTSDLARAALQETATLLDGLQIPTALALPRSTAEFAALGNEQLRISEAVTAYVNALRARCETAITGIEARHLPPCEPLPLSPFQQIRQQVALLAREATALERLPADDQERLARATELRDAQRLAQNLDIILQRADDLRLRRQIVNCRSALDTRQISQFATRRRRELVTPDLRVRIEEEIANFDLSHIPLRFEEETDHGRNLFDVALDTHQNARKSRVLSEGEQRALGIACFLADMSRVPGRHGIIVDDPVSSLDQKRLQKVARRLVDEAASGRQIVIFTHHLVFYQEVLSAAAAANPQVPVVVNVLGKSGDRFGIITENDAPWIAKKVMRRIEALRQRLNTIPANINRDTDDYRRLAKDFYTDLRESWERLVEEILLGSVVERFSSAVKTQSLKEVIVEDADYQTIYAAMKRVSEFSGHDMAAGRQLPPPDPNDMRRDVEAIDAFRLLVQGRKNALRQRRGALEQPPIAQLA